jgi:hypothetical protein
VVAGRSCGSLFSLSHTPTQMGGAGLMPASLDRLSPTTFLMLQKSRISLKFDACVQNLCLFYFIYAQRKEEEDRGIVVFC